MKGIFVLLAAFCIALFVSVAFAQGFNFAPDNSILDFSAIMNGSNIVLTAKCNKVLPVSVGFYYSQSLNHIQDNSITCDASASGFKNPPITLNPPPTSSSTILAVASISGSCEPCEKKTNFVFTVQKNPTIIPDISPVFLLLIISFVLLVLYKKGRPAK